MFQASALLHKMHTLQLSRKYVKSITPEKKAQVGLYIFYVTCWTMYYRYMYD